MAVHTTRPLLSVAVFTVFLCRTALPPAAGTTGPHGLLVLHAAPQQQLWPIAAAATAPTGGWVAAAHLQTMHVIPLALSLTHRSCAPAPAHTLAQIRLNARVQTQLLQRSACLLLPCLLVCLYTYMWCHPAAASAALQQPGWLGPCCRSAAAWLVRSCWRALPSWHHAPHPRSCCTDGQAHCVAGAAAAGGVMGCW